MKQFILISIFLITITQSTYPIALFHGIGDQCSNNAMKGIMRRLENGLNTKVYCIEIGNGKIDSIIKNFEKQAKEGCENIKKIPELQNKFNIFGVSQGTLLGRYIIEKCDMKGKVVNYLSFMGPQMGIGFIPKLTCGKICDYLNKIVSDIDNVLDNVLVNILGPASYWKYRYHYDRYMKHNKFLKDLNNEGEVKNYEYKNRMIQLNKVMLIKGKEDTVISPRDSSWFEFYDKEGKEIVKLENSDFYKDDYIGLRKLIEDGKVEFVLFSGEHVKYTEEEFQKYIIPFFADDGDKM